MMGLGFTSTGDRRSGVVPPPDAWRDLRNELDSWADSGRRATFWWRDDDAVSSTAALGRLLDLAREHGVRPALAVVPAKAADALFAVLAQRPEVAVIQHGYAHVNHAPRGDKKAELGAHRAAETVLAELAKGKDMLARASEGRAMAVLAPPWNRIDLAVAARLAPLGFRGLSTAKPRAARRDAFGVLQVNVHVDPIDWPGLRAGMGGFAGAEATLAAAVAHLRARRLGAADADELTGLLTHHLVMDEPTWAFVDRFLAATADHPGAAWQDPADVFDTEL